MAKFIRSIDSIGANVAEGFGRYRYLDKNKFNYNTRGSLFESIHWVELLYERRIISQTEYKNLKEKLNKIGVKLNNLINSTKKANKQ